MMMLRHMPHMAREPFPAEYTQALFLGRRDFKGLREMWWWKASVIKPYMSKGTKQRERRKIKEIARINVICLICDVSDEWARQEKLDEILDYLRGVGSSGKKVEVRFGYWTNWSRLCRSNSKHTCGAFWRVYVLFLQALENRLDEAGHEKMVNMYSLHQFMFATVFVKL